MMSSKKDMRKADLVIPYVDPVKSVNDKNSSGTMASTLPMAAMFTRNKMIAWYDAIFAFVVTPLIRAEYLLRGSLVFSLQTWLAETPEQSRTAGTPGYLSVGMAAMAIVVTYLPLFLPPIPAKIATGTEAPPPAPAS